MSKCPKTSNWLNSSIALGLCDKSYIESCLAEIDAMEAELTKAYDKGYVDGADHQNESNRKNIIEKLEAENKRYREALEDIESGICFNPEYTASKALEAVEESEK